MWDVLMQVMLLIILYIKRCEILIRIVIIPTNTSQFKNYIRSIVYPTSWNTKYDSSNKNATKDTN